MASLGSAYVQIVPQAQGISGSISQLLGPEAASAGATAGEQINSGMSRGIRSAAGSIVSTVGGALTSVSATGASVISSMTASLTNAAISGGLARAMGIDDAQAKFRQLGMDVDKTMESVMASVDSTRYASNDMAAVAVNLGSAGVESGEAMTAALKSVASVASISGKDLSDIGAIYTKVASAGHVTGDVIQQLSLNGINATAALAQSMGKTTDEISAMVSSGQIDMQTFSTAMSDYFGDAADSANSTFSGALSNVRAKINQIGQAFMSPVLTQLQTVFAGTEGEANGLLDALKLIKDEMQPFIDQWTRVVELIGGQVASAVATFVNTMRDGGGIIASFKAALADLVPDVIKEKFAELDPAMQSFLAVVGKVGAVVAAGAAGWGVLTGAIGSLVPGLGALLGPLAGAGGAFKMISTAGGGLTKVLSAMVGGTGLASAEMGGLTGKLAGLAGPIGWAVAAFGLLMAKSEPFRKSIIQLAQTLAAGIMPILKSLMPLVKTIIQVVGNLAKTIGDALAPIITALIPVVRAMMQNLLTGIQTIMPLVQAVLSVVGTVVGGIAKAISAVLLPVIRVASSLFTAWSTVVRSVMNAAYGIVSGAISKISAAFAKIKSVVATVSSVFGTIKAKMTAPIEKARDIIKKAIEKIKGLFPLSVGKLFSNLKIPKITVEGGKAPWGIGGKGKLPSFDVQWNAQAMDAPYMFSGATLFGAGETGDEILYGRSALMRDIASAVGTGGHTINIYSTVEGAENPEDYADRLVRRLKLEMRTV